MAALTLAFFSCLGFLYKATLHPLASLAAAAAINFLLALHVAMPLYTAGDLATREAEAVPQCGNWPIAAIAAGLCR